MSNKYLSPEEKVEFLISLYKKNLLKEALLKAEIFAKEHPNNPSIHNIYGIIHSGLENYKKSILVKKKQKSLHGINVSDILIMRNWLGYAKKISDLSYKNIIDDITIQSLIEKKLSNQLLERSKQFNSYYN